MEIRANTVMRMHRRTDRIAVNQHLTPAQDRIRVRKVLDRITDDTNKITREEYVVGAYRANYVRRRIILLLEEARPRLSAKALMRKARNR